MQLLIFGKSGQVASELCLQAQAAGYDFVALSRDDVDVCDGDAIKAAIASNPCDAVINATAYTNVDGAESEQDLANVINADAPYIMAQAAAQKQVPFLHISTDYVFRGNGDKSWNINDPIDPPNHYGVSKATGERFITSTEGRNIIMRTSWVFSSHGKNFVKTVLRIARVNDALNIVGDQIGGPTSAVDIASALLNIAKQEYEKTYQTGTQIIHYAGVPCVSWAEFAREIVKKAGIEVVIHAIPTTDYPIPAARPLNSRLDSSHLALLYGLSAPDWRIALDDCLKRIKANDTA